MVGDGVAAILEGDQGALLASHGAVTRGPDLQLAQARMESLEHAARILLSARRAGPGESSDSGADERTGQAERDIGT
jgi:ribulose-5-phosphate 4-epimerase/fuculose-1-phosphate aldolase